MCGVLDWIKRVVQHAGISCKTIRRCTRTEPQFQYFVAAIKTGVTQVIHEYPWEDGACVAVVMHGRNMAMLSYRRGFEVFEVVPLGEVLGILCRDRVAIVFA